MTSLNPDSLSESLRHCSEHRCNGLGDCVTVNGLPACDCMLGYTGDTCRETVNGGLAVPLTLGVLGVLFGFVVLAFLFAYFRQKKRAEIKNQTDDTKEILEKNGDFNSSPHGETEKKTPGV